MKDKIYDVAVIGGGITGTGVIHELAKYKLDTALLERGLDLAVGATKGNGGVVHPGYDPHPGTLKAKLNPAGARMYPRLSKELGFGLRRTGTLVVAYSDRDLKKVDELLDNAAVNGVDQVEKIDAAQLRHREPHISQAALGALLAHTTTMIDPFEVAIAFAENAQDNGADILTGQNVTDLRKEDDGLFHITASGNQYLARFVVDAAGIFADDVAAMAGIHEYRIQGRHGNLVVIFHDPTNGAQTAAWRRAPLLPDEGGWVVDFNRAQNFPAHFTPFGTCPTPPEGQGVPLAVHAGEKAPAEPVD